MIRYHRGVTSTIFGVCNVYNVTNIVVKWYRPQYNNMIFCVSENWMYSDKVLEKPQNFYRQMPLHTEAFTQRSFYTQKLLHTDASHKYVFAQRGIYAQTPVYTDAFTQKRFHTQKLLHRETFAQNSFTQKPLQRNLLSFPFQVMSANGWHWDIQISTYLGLSFRFPFSIL